MSCRIAALPNREPVFNDRQLSLEVIDGKYTEYI